MKGEPAPAPPTEAPAPPDAARSVYIAGSVVGGVVIAGDNNSVVFDAGGVSPDSYLIDPSPIYARLGSGGWTTRPAIVQAIDDFLAANASGYVVIEADAGMGKTSLLASLAQDRGYPVHFVELMLDPHDADAALRNLAVQLIDRYSLGETFAPAGHLRPVPAELLFHDALVEASTAGAGSGQPVILLVDALDVAGTRTNQNPLALPRVLPPGAFIVVSTRPGTSIITTSPRTVIPLSASSPANRADLARHVEQECAADPLARRLQEAGVEPGDFARSVADGSGGVWIIARHLLDEVRRGRRSAVDLDAPIPSLWHFYRASVFSILDAEPSDLPVVALLSCAAVPVPIRFIVDVLSPDVDQARVEQVLDRWTAFLSTFRDGATRYAPYHRSFREFLAGVGVPEDVDRSERERARRLAEAVDAQHHAIADRYLVMWGGMDAGLERARSSPEVAMLDDGYGLHHLIGHLCDGGRADDAERLAWLETADPEPVSVWWLLKARHLGLSAYRRDIDRLIAARRDSSQHAARLALGWIHASLNSYVARLPPSVLPDLVAQGRLSIDEAWANIQLLPDPESQSEALTSLSEIAPDDRAVEIEAAALASLQRIEGDYWRLSELVRFDRARRHTPPEQVYEVARGLTPGNQRLASRLLSGPPDESTGLEVESDPERGNQPAFVEAYLERRRFAESLVGGWIRARAEGTRLLAVSGGPDWISLVASSDPERSGHEGLDPRRIAIGDHREGLWADFGRVADFPASGDVARPRLTPMGEVMWRLAAALATTGAIGPEPMELLLGLSEDERRAVLDALVDDVSRLSAADARALVDTVSDAPARSRLWVDVCIARDASGPGHEWRDVLDGLDSPDDAGDRVAHLAAVAALAPAAELASMADEAAEHPVDAFGTVVRTAIACRSAELGASPDALLPRTDVIGPFVDDARLSAPPEAWPDVASGAEDQHPDLRRRWCLAGLREDPGDELERERTLAEWRRLSAALPLWARTNELAEIAPGLTSDELAHETKDVLDAMAGRPGPERAHVLVELARCFTAIGRPEQALAIATGIDPDEPASRCLLDIIERRPGRPLLEGGPLMSAIRARRSAAVRGKLALALARAIAEMEGPAASPAYASAMDQVLGELVEWTRSDVSGAMPDLLACLSAEDASASPLIHLATRISRVYSWWR